MLGPKGGLSMSHISLFAAAYPTLFLLLFAITYIGAVACCVPGIFLLSCAAGYYFGLSQGLLLVIVAANAGSYLCMRVTRHLWSHRRVPERLRRWSGMSGRLLQGSGFWGLVGLRWISVLPYYGINLALASSQLSLSRAMASTALGMLPLHIIFVLIGTRTADLEHLPQLLNQPWTWGLTLGGLSLSLFPWLQRSLRKRRLRHRDCTPPTTGSQPS